MIFIRKIFEKKVDDDVHKQFTRFGKGVFENRACMLIKKGKNNFKVYMSYDLLKDVIELLTYHIQKADITGKIIKGKKKSEISATVSPEELRKMYEENEFLLLDISAPNIVLKCKKSLPKPGKELNIKFASATLPLTLIKEFVFDNTDQFKLAKISHTFIITDIQIPDEYKKNFELARIHAKRKGTITRILEIDGRHEERSIDFMV